jgi:hypothetical protein
MLRCGDGVNGERLLYFVILGSTQDPEPRRVPFVALGPDFRQDDDVGVALLPLVRPGFILRLTAIVAWRRALLPIAS